MSDDLLNNVVDDPRLGPQQTQEAEGALAQPGGFVLELSQDWIVQRASENVHRFLGESHVTLIDEPLSRFVQSQPLHDLRNLFSRLSGTTGIARAYDIRLTGDGDRFDVAFQQGFGHVLLQGLPTANCFGETFGSVGGLAEGLNGESGEALLEAAARRMRALTGFDAVRVEARGAAAESSRRSFDFTALPSGLPPMLVDTSIGSTPMFPRKASDPAMGAALLRSPSTADLETLRELDVASALHIPLKAGGETVGAFTCVCRLPDAATMELHAAAELFAQLFALRLEIDRLERR